jgi:hypothetical protein
MALIHYRRFPSSVFRVLHAASHTVPCITWLQPVRWRACDMPRCPADTVGQGVLCHTTADTLQQPSRIPCATPTPRTALHCAHSQLVSDEKLVTDTSSTPWKLDDQLPVPVHHIFGFQVGVNRERSECVDPSSPPRRVSTRDWIRFTLPSDRRPHCTRDADRCTGCCMPRVVPTTVVNSAGLHRQVHPIASAQLPVYLEQCLLKLEHIWLQIDPESARLIKAAPLCTKHALTQTTQSRRAP